MTISYEPVGVELVKCKNFFFFFFFLVFLASAKHNRELQAVSAWISFQGKNAVFSCAAFAAKTETV